MQSDVLEVVEAGEQADFRELADAGDEAEADMGVAILDDRVEPAQEVAVGAGDLRRVQRVQNRLVVLVHQDDRPLPGLGARRPYQMPEAFRGRVVAGRDAELLLQDVELGHQVDVQVARFLEVAAAEAEAQHRMAHRPVPAVVDGEPFEQRLVALEQLLAGVEEQALAEAPRTREEVVSALVEQPANVGGLVHVVALVLADRSESLHAEGQLASRHGSHTDRGRNRSQSVLSHPESLRRANRADDATQAPGRVFARGSVDHACRRLVRGVGPAAVPEQIRVGDAAD